jgi:hypothetical protein
MPNPSAAIFFRVSGELFRRFEDWRREQPVIPHRSDAARQLMERGLPDHDEPVRTEPA